METRGITNPYCDRHSLRLSDFDSLPASCSRLQSRRLTLHLAWENANLTALCDKCKTLLQ